MEEEASALEALVCDPSKCSKLSMEQKRELIYEMAKWPECVSEMLQSWSRQEILQILCAELGKERKYTGLTKSKIIENLLKIVYEKKSQEPINVNISNEQPSLENGERTHKRQRKSDNPNRLFVALNGATTVAYDVDLGDTVYCKNSACKAKLNHEDLFCKRCSCCICCQYDDNKDPSLWLICNSDPPFCGVSCGMSCHLECALRHEKSGILQDKGIDGSFRCVSCGKANDLLSSWRKQLLVARDTRRVDILCYRLSLSQKILVGTKQYQNLYEIIEEAVEKLEEDVGPLTGLPVKKARGIVNRLSSGQDIQRLCASALESLDSLLSHRASGCNMLDSKLVRFEDIRASSLIIYVSSDDSNMGNIGYSLWHRRADDKDYPTQPTHRLLKSNTKFLLCGLTPSTQYLLKVVSHDTSRGTGFSEFQFQTGSPQFDAPNTASKVLETEGSQSPATNCSTLSNPSSIEDETNNVLPRNKGDETRARANNYLPIVQNADKGASDQSQREETTIVNEDALLKESSNGQTGEETSTDTPCQTGLECVPYVDSLPITPCKFENVKDDNLRSNRPKFSGKGIENGSEREQEPQAGSSSKKRSGETRDDKCTGIGDKDFEYYVKVIRWLECEGHIDTSFRQKFLTWYSLRATPQEVRIVKVFVDTFIEDPESLAGQLVDSFSDVVSGNRCSRVPVGFCSKLWH